MSDTRLTNTLGLLLFAAIIAMGLWMSGHFAWRAWMAGRSGGWPAAAGRVTSSGVCEHLAKTITYYPCIRYEYSVGGRVFEGTRIMWGHKDTGSRREAERTASRYAAGTGVEVFYDPESPETACLEPGAAAWETYGLIALGLFCAATGVYLMRRQFVRPRRGRRWRR